MSFSGAIFALMRGQGIGIKTMMAKLSSICIPERK